MKSTFSIYCFYVYFHTFSKKREEKNVDGGIARRGEVAGC
jgi:hypothetical protein